MTTIEVGRAITKPVTKDFIHMGRSKELKPVFTRTIKKDMKNDMKSATRLLKTRLKCVAFILTICNRTP